MPEGKEIGRLEVRQIELVNEGTFVGISDLFLLDITLALGALAIEPALEDIFMEQNLQEKAQLLKTLGHPLRLRIVAGLAGKCACVKEIWECLELPQAVVSQHLKVMKESGLLESRREGVRVCYSLKDDMLVELVRLLQVDV